MRSTLALIIAVISACAANPVVRDPKTNVRYNGVFRSDVEYFLSIPYGQDTAGSNRFKSPRPVVPRHGSTVDATVIRPACPQPTGQQLAPFYVQDITEISEDCLFLNVARPNGTKAGDNLPVMVFIHGGSFYLGSKDEPACQAGALIQQSIANGHPVIQVNINYRLGIFGFAQSDALRKEGSLNAGLKDQRLALEWVRDNIAHFGGDCEKITIFGQSSGGLAVGLQQLAYGGSKPLPFQQAICESQALEPGITGDFTRKAMTKVAANVSCDTTDLQSAKTIACLRALTLPQLLAGQANTHAQNASANVGDEWLPVVDGDFLPAPPSQLIATGRFHRVPFMSTTCQDDANPFIDQNITTAKDTYNWFRDYLPGFSARNLDALLHLYPVREFSASPSKPAEFYRAGRILRDIIFICQPLLLGRAIVSPPRRNDKHDNDDDNSKKPPPFYVGIQNQSILEPVLASLGLPDEGIVHTSEFAYVFANFTPYAASGYPVRTGPAAAAADVALQVRESRSWSSFAALGRPSVRGKGTLQGWEQAFSSAQGTDIFIIGGVKEGLASTVGKSRLAGQRIEERCGFLNSAEIIKELGY